MPTTDWYTLGTITSDSANSGSVAWTNPSNADAQDDTDATVTYSDLTPAPVTEYLKCLDVFGINTTGWNAVTGVDVRIRAKHTVNSGTPAPNYSRVSQVFGGTIQSEDPATGEAIGTSYAYQTYSFSSDIPTPAQVAASDYGVVIECGDNGFGPRNGTIEIDAVFVRFTYSRNTNTPSVLEGRLTYRVHAKLDNGNDQREWNHDIISVAQNASGGMLTYLYDCNFQLQYGSAIEPGIVFMSNVSPEDEMFVTYGPLVSGAMVPFGRIKAGEDAVFRLDPDTVIAFEPQYGECVVKVWVMND